MSEDALNASIMSKLAEAGLDPSSDDRDYPAVPDDSDDDSVDDTDIPVDDDAAPADEPADETPAEEPIEEPVEEEEAAPAEEEAKTPAETIADTSKEEQDELAEALGLGKPPADPKQRAKWWKKMLPYSQVNKGFKTVKQKLIDSHTAQLKERDEKLTTHESKFAEYATVEKFIVEQQEAYLQSLMDLFPDTYGKLLSPLFNRELPKEEDLGPMPQPDYDLGDGKFTYSVEGLQKLDEWKTRKITQDVLKQFKPQMDFLEKQKQNQQKQRSAEEEARIGKETAAKVISRVKTWKGGAENIDAIIAAAQKLDPKLSAHEAMTEAYLSIVIPKFIADRETMRKELQEEAKKAAIAKRKTVSVPAKVSTPKQTEPKGDSEEAMNARIKQQAARKGIKL